MIDPKIAVDLQNRDQIKNDITSNLFVSAGAGSGKTTSLVDRMVSMVKSGIDVSKICAITFTKAAANEFYSRFQHKLIEESMNSSLPQSQKDLCLSASKNIDLAFMGTIDSFCNMVLTEHPAEARIPSDSKVLDDDEIESGLRKEYFSICNGDFGSHLLDLSNSFVGVTSVKLAPDVFVSTVKKLMDNRNATINWKTTPVPSSDIDQIQNEILDLIEKIEMDETQVYTGNRPSVEAWDDAKSKKEKLKNDWKKSIPEIITFLNSFKKLRLEITADLSSLGSLAEAIFVPFGKRESCYEINKDAFYPLTVLRNYQYQSVMEFTTEASVEIFDKWVREGKLTYFGCQYLLCEMLKRDADCGGKLISHIYNRHSYFLLDEFQDTNPIQAEIFFMLTADVPNSDWMKCTPKAGSLFIVGDPKQSIYRFRQADVASFKSVENLFISPKGNCLTLDQNFRSTVFLRKWFNRTFSKILCQEDKYQSKFTDIPIPDSDEDLPDEFTGVFSYTAPLRENPSIPSDAELIETIIRKLVHNPAYRIKEKKTGVLREIEYRDVMIITPTKGKITSLIHRFTESKIPYYVEGKVSFDDCPSLKMATDIFTGVSDPYNSFSTFNMENMGLTGTSNTKEEAKNLPFSTLFAKILRDYQVFRHCGTYNMELCYYAEELLRSAEISGKISSLKEARDFLKNLSSKENDIERSIGLTDDTNKIHIANLHKVKGLESPIVILANAQKKASAPEFHAEYSVSGPQFWLLNTGDIKSNDFSSEEEEETKFLTAEYLRLQYVAATRAENALIVSQYANSYGLLESSYWYNILEYIDSDAMNLLDNPIVPAAKPEIDITSLYDKTSADPNIADSDSLKASYSLKRPSKATIKSLASGEDDFEDELDDASRTRTVKKNAALIGTMVHRLMEVLVSSRNSCDLFPTAEDIVHEFVSDDPGDYYYNILLKVGNTVRNGGFSQKTSVPQDILSELLSAEEVHCEVPFCYMKPGDDNLWHGVMDVIYQKNGKWHIIDYKTNADASDLDAEYQKQLSGYMEAMKELTGNVADALIYHIDI